MNMELIVFDIINYGGTAKGLAYEALTEVERGHYEEAEKLLKEADEYLKKAHKVQTEIIQKEANGEKAEVSVLFVHAQDHLMTAIEAKNLIECIIRLYRKLDNK